MANAKLLHGHHAGVLGSRELSSPSIHFHSSPIVLQGSNYSTTGELINRNVYFRRNLAISAAKTYDLVIIHRTLIEMPSKEERMELIRQLWSRTNRFCAEHANA
jgi:hypothetical protein